MVFQSEVISEVRPASILRREVIGDSKVNVTDLPIRNVLGMAQKMAVERNEKNNDDAFMLIDLDVVYDRFRLWKEQLPHIEPFYAVKCNSDPVMLRALAQLGVGFDCASREEIDTVLSLGVSSDRLIYANPCKTRSYIKHAEENGVTMMTFDNAEELEKVVKLHVNPDMILRIAVSDPTATCPLNLKFGAEPTIVAPQLLFKAAQMGVNVRGISFHVGSGCNDPTAYHTALRHARNLFEVGEALGMQMTLLDMGGGFPGSNDHHLKFEDIAATIRHAVDEYFPDSNVRLIAEPGRYFAAKPFTLVANIITATQCSAEKITKDENDVGQPGFMYYLNDGVYGSFNCILFDHAHPVGRPLFEDVDAPCYPTTVWGPTCDSLDKIEDQKQMPRLEVGDWMIYEDMGAYTCAASTTFNGFPRPHNVYILSEQMWQLLGL